MDRLKVRDSLLQMYVAGGRAREVVLAIAGDPSTQAAYERKMRRLIVHNQGRH